jgi:hypothetical protein
MPRRVDDPTIPTPGKLIAVKEGEAIGGDRAMKKRQPNLTYEVVSARLPEDVSSRPGSTCGPLTLEDFYGKPWRGSTPTA